MPSHLGARAIEDATRHGNAILKFISPNDVGLTGSHQCGYYLPKSAWELFTPHAPLKGQNTEHSVMVRWPDDRETESRVKWYGMGTRSEYRLTRFGKDFPYLSADCVGDLLVLIPRTLHEFIAHVLDLEEDIDEIQAALGIEVTSRWAVYKAGEAQIETADDCIDRNFKEFARPLTEFPDGRTFSDATRRFLQECIATFRDGEHDHRLMLSIDMEYRLFRFVERQICRSDVTRVFRDIDDFLRTASQIMNRRKARAGRSLENHVEFFLKEAGVPHEMRPDIDGKPDVIIPSAAAYRDGNYPAEKLFAVGVKTTCKDRWRQVLNEAHRVRKKHIFTIQQGISIPQLREMHTANVTLVVPKPLHRLYPAGAGIKMMDLHDFAERVRRTVRRDLYK